MQKLTTQGIKAQHEVTVSNQAKATPKPNYRQKTKKDPRPATDRQLEFFMDLLAERVRPEDYDEAHIEAIVNGGSQRVSLAIDKLLMMPRIKREAPKAQAKAQAPRTNKYRGTCEECGFTVEPGTGTLTKTDNGKWEVSHKEGDCPSSQFDFPFGRYAVETDEGHLAFYRLTPDGLFVQASDELHRVPGNAEQAIVDKIAADPKAASIRYGLEIGSCGRCGRTLTDEDSRARGIGPVCAEKAWS